MALILVTPSTTCATSGPNSSWIRLDRGQRVLDDVVQEAGGDRHRVELHVGEQIRDGKGVDQVGFAGMPHLPPVLVGREHIRPPQQFDVSFRSVGPDLFEEFLEANHKNRCLTSCWTPRFSMHRDRLARPQGWPCAVPGIVLDLAFLGSLY